MSKRGSNSSKQRKRGSSPVSKSTPDPFVNGQIPACRELLTAIRDVFPELQPSSSTTTTATTVTSTASTASVTSVTSATSATTNTTTTTTSNETSGDSSAFGKLLRWHYLDKRKAKSIMPPPLTFGDRNESETSATSNNKNNNTNSNKKKKKRKKKKKGGAGGQVAEVAALEATMEATMEANANNSSDDNKSLDPFEAAMSKIPTSRPQSRRGSLQYPPSAAGSRRGSLAGSRRGSLTADEMHDSTYFFDQIQPQNSTQELLSPTQFIKQIRPEVMPGLPNLESDDEPSSSHHQEDFLFSPTQFLKQMPKEETTSQLPTLDILNDSADEDDGGMMGGNENHSHNQNDIGNGNGNDNGGDSPGTPKIRGSPGSKSAAAAAAAGTPSQGGNTEKSSSTNTLNSPNHEWVPAETGASQQETAPGDAIKGPLTLPYLMTFSEGPGTLTTKTIDGSLVSAALPTHQEPTRMETTKILFEEWLGQLNNGNGNGNNDGSNLTAGAAAAATARDPKEELAAFVDFLQARTHGQPRQVGIPFEQLQSACSNIKSYTCRQTASTEVKKILQAAPKMVVLDASCLHEETKTQTGMTVDAAFDYVALEEGHHAPSQQPGAAEDEEVFDLTKSISFTLSGPAKGAPNQNAAASTNSNNSSNNNGSNNNNNNTQNQNLYLYIRELSEQHLDTLTEEWLPCGIEEDVMVTTVVQDGNSDSPLIVALSPKELQQIQKRVAVKEKEMKHGFRQTESSKNALLEQFEKKSGAAVGIGGGSGGSMNNSSLLLNIDFNSFPQLQRCDRQCGELMDGCVDVLKILSKENTHALADVQMQFWSTCLVALNKVLKSAKNYYNKIEHHADQNGSLPKIFISADMRELFRELVDEKQTAWTDVGNTYEQVMSSRALREYYTRTSWFEFKSQSSSSSSPPPPTTTKTNSRPITGLDEQCFELLDQLMNWTETILGRRMSDIYKTRIGQTNHVLELLQKVVDPLTEQYATVERFFSSERNVYFANLRSQIVLVRSVKKQMRLLDQDEVESMVMGVLLMWRQTRIMQSRMIQSQAIPPLPLQLKKWMLQDDLGSDQWNWDPVSETSIPVTRRMNYPLGAGGKRRAMCVLAGLTYQWLGDRYKEWQAEVAEQELLTDFMTTESGKPAITNGESKSAKKRKKKKKKSGGMSPPRQRLERAVSNESRDSKSVDITGDDSFTKSLDESSKGVEKEPAVIQPTLSAEEVEEFIVIKKRAEEVVVAEPPTLDAIPFSEEEVAMNAIPFAAEEEAFPFANIDDYASAVCITGGFTDMSADDFLIERMEELLAGLSPDGNPVVIV